MQHSVSGNLSRITAPVQETPRSEAKKKKLFAPLRSVVAPSSEVDDELNDRRPEVHTTGRSFPPSVLSLISTRVSPSPQAQPLGARKVNI